MPALTPNSPQSRFEYVLKLYWGKEYKGESLNGPVLDTFYVTTSLLGDHNLTPDRFVTYSPGDLVVKYDRDDVEVERVQKLLDLPEPATGASAVSFRAEAARRSLARLGQPYEYNARNEILWDSEQWALADVVLTATKLPDRSPKDFLIPWVARELVKLGSLRYSNTQADKSNALRKDYYDAVHTLYDKAPAIAQWAKETKTDVGKVDLAQALEAIATYKFKESLIEQGAVVYEYEDGWTVQELRTETALTQEGDAMQNCIGGYCEDVGSREVRIYSIRDGHGKPHVSMELRPPAPTPIRLTKKALPPMSLDLAMGVDMEPEEFIASPARLTWHFEQILGKQNDRPIGEYRRRALEFIGKIFDKEGLGWVIAGGAPEMARFAGREWTSIDFENIASVNHLEEGSAFVGTNFDDSFVNLCKFNHIAGPASFARAEIYETLFVLARLRHTSFDGAMCHFSNFEGASLVGASFDHAHLGGSSFNGADVRDASFRGAKVSGATFGLVDNAGKADWNGVDLSDAQREQLRAQDIRDVKRRA